jgi:Mobilization protein NikA
MRTRQEIKLQTAVLHVRMYPEELEEIRRCAVNCGMSVSAWARTQLVPTSPVIDAAPKKKKKEIVREESATPESGSEPVDPIHAEINRVSNEAIDEGFRELKRMESGHPADCDCMTCTQHRRFLQSAK